MRLRNGKVQPRVLRSATAVALRLIQNIDEPALMRRTPSTIFWIAPFFDSTFNPAKTAVRPMAYLGPVAHLRLGRESSPRARYRADG